MKTFFKQYLLSWIKFLVLTPGVIMSILCRIICSIYTLFAAALLGDGKMFSETMSDIIDSIRV